jgi:hypothetical protein
VRWCLLAPRPLGFDEQGREVLTFLEGETIGRRKPRPAWVHAEDTLVQVAHWMRACHEAVADFVPPPGAVWRGGGIWSPGLIIAHNDAATYNAAWHQGRLTGFFDWDFAGPATPEFLDVVEARIKAHADGIRDLAAAGDEAFGRLVDQGVSDALDQAIAELASFPR